MNATSEVKNPHFCPDVKPLHAQRGEEVLTWMPFSDATPMYRKTPYSTGMGMY